MNCIRARQGGFVTFVKSNAKALSTAVPSIKSTLAPCRGARRPRDVCSAPTEAERRPILACGRCTSVLTSATFPCLLFIQERATPLSYGIQRRITIESQPVFPACPDTPVGLFLVLPLMELFLILYIIHALP